LISTGSSHADGQGRAIYDQGALGLSQVLKRINTSASVMMIGAHPDDEDTALLAYLARGENARTAYLSLTRGDGGQNIIGPELRESLGVIRTEELLQARKLDGAEQYFTRAYDYGFSKTLDEAKQKWDEKVILCDAVRAIRLFRPLVVISRFSGTPADGHGQHQYAGYISPLAVKAAGDIGRCADAGPAWQVRKFYVSQGFRSTAEPKLRINTGQYDPLLGRSYFEIAMQARSQHKSQEQGVLELNGPQFSGVNLVGGDAKETSVFDGLDVSIRGIALNTGNSESSFTAKLQGLQDVAARALANYDFRSPEKIVPLLAEGYKLAHDAEESTRNPGSKAFLQKEQIQFTSAIRLAAGIQIDALADRETATPGDTFPVAVRLFAPDTAQAALKDVKWNLPAGWTATAAETPKDPSQPGIRRETPAYATFFNISIANDAEPTQPYWLQEPRDGDFYHWNAGDASRTLPFQDSPSASVTVSVGGTDVSFSVPVQYRFADDTRGEVRRNVEVVPTISIELDQQLLIVPTDSAPTARRVVMSITNNSAKPIAGSASLKADNGLKYVGESKQFAIAKRNEKATLSFDIAIPPAAKPGTYQLEPRATAGGNTANLTMNLIAYPHIQTHRFYTPAAATVRVLDLAVSPVKVGYIEGSGDAVPGAIRQIGLQVAMLNEDDLSSGDLSKFDVIVVGIRASQVRPDFVANQPRLMDYVKNGGTLIVQYQLPVYQSLLPFPAQIGPRVADENAPVSILMPGHPIFKFPNKITQADFSGWIQERNLNDLTNFDPKYTPLLESHDPGEPENKGGLVVADIGKGKFIYCSYSLFRQLPAGVPGAYRLLANMLSQPKAKSLDAR
jgi:LmbE family N-acetylglucosaminyl deacetylase